MKHALVAAAFALGTTLALAQAPAPAPAPEIPKHKCDPQPDHPGRLATDNMRRNFDRANKTYEGCMKGYLEERKAAIVANEKAANDVINEFNAYVTKMRAASGIEDTKK